MSIPKIIHYCWFGPKEFTDLEKNCIQTWKEKLPDYEIMFWNEDTFDVDSVPYTKQAYKHERYAFVSDYARLNALYNYGGIYLDTDIEILKSFDKFIEDKMFIGFENRTMVAVGVLGAEKGEPFIKELLDFYHKYPFEDEKGNIDITTIVQKLTPLLEKRGLTTPNSEQMVDYIHVYDRDVFYPKKMKDGTFRVTDESYTIHRYAGSWLTEREKRRGESTIWRNFFRPVLRKTRSGLTKVLGYKKTKQIEASLRKRMK